MPISPARSLAARLLKKTTGLELLSRRLVNLWPYACRQRPEFWSFLEELERTQYLDPAAQRERQLVRLLDTLEHAYTRSGFYRRLYDEQGVRPAQVQSFDDFARLVPVVEKAQLRDATYLSVPMHGTTCATTSGTSGSPFVFPVDPAALAMEQAAVFHQWKRAGFSPGDRRIEMRSFQVEPIVLFPEFRVTRLSIINMEEHLDRMLEHINRNRIEFIHGYPSAIAKFSLLMRERGLSLDYPVKGVFFTSENVYDWQADAVQSVLDPASIIAHYGSAERTVTAAWCKHRREYHFLPLYGYLETGPSDEIIGTGFLNRATPFIRYRTSDVVMGVHDTACPECGRGSTPRVERIGGRLEDYLVDERDELIPPAVVTFPFKQLRAIRAVQVFQASDRHVTLRCVLSSGHGDALQRERDELQAGFQKLLGASIQIRFDDVREIPLSGNCKFKWIISEAAKVRLG